MSAAANLPASATGDRKHDPDKRDNQPDCPKDRDVCNEPNDHQDDAEDNHDDFLSVRLVQCRHVAAPSVIRRSQYGQGVESTRLAGDKYAKDSAGMGSQQ